MRERYIYREREINNIYIYNEKESFYKLIFRLSLVNNRIEEIEDKALGHCVQLRFLDLRGNRLKTLGMHTTISNLTPLTCIQLYPIVRYSLTF